MNNRNNMYNINSAFSKSSPLIEQPQYTNPHTTLHDNLHNNLAAEHIVEYYINIDSDDRNLDVYPDPYNFVVSFKPIGKSIDRRQKFKKGGVVFENTSYDETPGPVIIRNFKNVKYVKLDRVILSRHIFNKYIITHDIKIDANNILTTSSTIKCKILKKIKLPCENKDDEPPPDESCDICNICCSDDCCCILSDITKYVILKVKELEIPHVYSTNTVASDNAFILYPDKTLGFNYNMWFATYGSCIYPNSLLTNIDRLTIEFYNKKGNRITAKIAIEYNVNITYVVDSTTTPPTTATINLKYCLLFGKFDNCQLEQIKKIYPNIISFKLNDICKPEIWYEKVFNEIIKLPALVDIKEILLENYIKCLDSLKNLDLCDKLKCISNNLFFIIGVVQNELTTMTKFNM